MIKYQLYIDYREADDEAVGVVAMDEPNIIIDKFALIDLNVALNEYNIPINRDRLIVSA